MASDTENRDQQNKSQQNNDGGESGTTLSSDSYLHSGLLDSRDQHLDKAHDYHLDQKMGESAEQVNSNLHLGNFQGDPHPGANENPEASSSDFAPAGAEETSPPVATASRSEDQFGQSVAPLPLETQSRSFSHDVQPSGSGTHSDPSAQLIPGQSQGFELASAPARADESARHGKDTTREQEVELSTHQSQVAGSVTSDLSAVSDIDQSSNAVEENAALGTATGIQANADVAEGASVEYSLLDDAGGLFAIDPETGIVTVSGSLDAETAGQHEIVVLATASDGETQTETFTINIRDVDEYDVSPISETGTRVDQISEDIAGGSATGIDVFAEDLDVSDSVSYAVDDPRFEIDADGIVTIADGASFDAETEETVTFTVTATSTDGSQTSQDFSLKISDVDEFSVSDVTDTDGAANSITEDAAAGTQVGITALATDADATDAVTYSVSDDRFEVAADGTVTVDSGASFDAETEGSIDLTVTATSTDGSTSQETFTISVADVNESAVSDVTDTDGAANSITEDAAAGTQVGITALATDTDATDTVTYSVSDDRFEVAADGTVTVASGASFDAETEGSIDLTVTATSTDGSTSQETFTISVADVNESAVSDVTDTDGAANSITEDAAAGTQVGITALATDADATDSVTYSVSDDRFEVAADGTVTVASGASFDAETEGSIDLTVTATSTDGSTSQETFTISVADVNESAVSDVTDTDGSANTIDEDAAAGTQVGITALATDADATDSVTYSVSDDRFEVAADGTVTVASGASFDAETEGSIDLTVTATSTDGSTSQETFTISVADVNESAVSDVTDTDGAANSIAEDVAAGTQVGITALATDNDVTDTVSYSVSDDRFEVAADGIVTVASGAAFDFESEPTVSLTVTATSLDGSQSSETFTINVSDVAEAYRLPSGNTSFVDEGVAETVIIGNSAAETITAHDDGSIIYSGAGDDTVHGGDGDDHILFGQGADTVYGGDGNDKIDDESGTIISSDANLLDGGAGDDKIWGGGGNDTIIGGTGSDKLSGEGDHDTLEGGAGDDTLYGGDGTDTAVFSGNFADYSITQNDNGSYTVADTRPGTPDGTDTVYDVENFRFADGDVLAADLIAQDIGSVSDADNSANQLYENAAVGTSVGITAKAEDGNPSDTVSFSVSDDRFEVAADGIVTVASGASFDFESEPSVSLTVTATSSDGSQSSETFTINVSDVAEAYQMPSGSNTFVDEGVAETSITGNYTHDTITAHDDGGTINGAGGNDTVFGGDSNDTIIGGTGNDTLHGGDGDDTFEVGLNHGDDVFDGGAGTDRVVATENDVEIGLAGNFTAGAVEEISANGNDNVEVHGNWQNNTLDFSETTLTDIDAIDGEGGNDVITGTSQADTIRGGTGNDTLHGGDGNDTFEVGLNHGDDVFDGGAGTDRVVATENDVEIGLTGNFTAGAVEEISANGNDNVEVHGNWQNNTLDFSETTLTDIDAIDGEGGNDVITGTSQADTIRGGTGNDTLHGGDGNDTFEVGLNHGDDVFDGGAGTDRVVATENDVEIGLAGNFTAGAVEEISANGNDNVEVHGNWQNNTLDFSETTLTDIDTIDGEGGNDVITGTDQADTIRGGTGNDTLHGGDGDDTFEVATGHGDDVFDGGAGTDRVVATENDVEIGLAGNFTAGAVEEISANGNDNVEVHGNWQNNTLDFSETTLTNIDAIDGEGGNDVITGTSQANTIRGGTGNDTLHGGAGNDTLEGGSGNDALYGGDGSDTAVFSGNVADYDITQNDDGSLTVADTRSGSPDGTDIVFDVETLRFADGDILSGDLVAQDVSQVIDADASANAIEENAAPGTSVGITAFAEDGNSSDTVSYSVSDNRFSVNADGVVTVAPDASFDFETDETVSLTVTATSTDGSTSSQSFSISVADVAEHLQLADGGASFSDTGVSEQSITGGSGNDTITAHDDGGVISGGNGTDMLLGGAGDDTLDGGVGADNDILKGGDGNDTYLLHGDGRADIISDAGTDGTDRIVLTSGTGSEFELEDTFNLATQGVEEIDGSAVSGETLRAQRSDVTLDWDFTGVTLNGVDRLEGRSGNDSITGSAGDDYIVGGSGNDTLAGAKGADLLQGGDGNDTMTLSGDMSWTGYSARNTETGDMVSLVGKTRNSDVFQGGSGTDTLVGTDQSDAIFLEDGITRSHSQASGARLDSIEIVDLGAGHDILDMTSNSHTYSTDMSIDGGTGNDVIWAADGNDTLDGGDGNDSLFGGKGNDTLDGGAGTDTALYSGNRADYDITENADGSYTVTDTRTGAPDGTDTVSNVENFSFADGDKLAGELIDSPVGPVTDANSAGNTFHETDVAGTQIGITASATDPDGDAISYTLSDDRFEIGSDGVVTIADHAFFDSQVENSVDLTVTATSADGSESAETFSIEITGDYDSDYTGGTGNGSFSGSGQSYFVDGVGGNDSITTGDHGDRIEGGAIAGTDQLKGNGGRDLIFGEGGDDVISGGSGDDVIVGGGDRDYMFGDDGSDLFMYGLGDGNDVISGGAGSAWTDVIDLGGGPGVTEAGDYGTDWTVTITDGSVVNTDTENGRLELSEDAHGSIDFADGSRIDFAEIEEIRW